MIDRLEAGRRMRAARESLGLSQHEAAARAGLSRPYLSDLESGKRVCAWPKLVEIVLALGYDPALVVPEFFPDRDPVRGPR